MIEKISEHLPHLLRQAIKKTIYQNDKGEMLSIEKQKFKTMQFPFHTKTTTCRLFQASDSNIVSFILITIYILNYKILRVHESVTCRYQRNIEVS